MGRGMERFLWLQVGGQGCQGRLASLGILETLDSADSEESMFSFHYLQRYQYIAPQTFPIAN